MQFEVHAIDRRQQVVSLSLDAVSETAAAEAARLRGLTVFSVRTTRKVLSWQARKARFPTLLFTIELAALLDAGLNLVEALSTLAEKGRESAVLSGLIGAIRRGEPFSQAVAAFPQHFPPLYVATVRASERTGNVREALGRYIAYQEELDKVKKKVVSATIYPAILAIVGALVVGFLMLYVVPRFARIYEDMAGTLPFFSRMLLGFGSFVGNNASLFILCFASTAALAGWAFSRPQFRSWLNTRLWAIPAIGERLKVYQLARLYRTAGMLLKAGIPAVQALAMVSDLLAAHLRPQLAAAKKRIESGEAMSAALGACGLATPVASRMMVVGERSGDMGGMFAQIARFHDDEVARFIDWFTRAFEPILMTLLGVSVGLVVVLMYMPIFELAGSIR
ncbi:MAG TPA: type II secretion system F family protein [Burkholderiales bacterium]|nr:type II secretion system F family protein [Burkholderiales bacterium]